MTPSLEYLAGFFDGEGCIYCRAMTERASILAMRVIVTNTNRDILEHYEKLFGGRITEKKRVASDHAIKDCFQWVGWNRHGLKAMKALAPYLILKKQKAEIYIKLYETIRIDRGSGSTTKDEEHRRRELLSLCA